MRPAIIPEHEPLEDLRAMTRKKENAPIRHRIQAVIQAREKKKQEDIADQIGVTRKTISNWLRKYREQGVDGLWDEKRPGQPTKLKREQEEVFKQRLTERIKSQNKKGLLKGLEIQAMLEKEFGAKYHLGGIYPLLKRLGFTWQKPRPKHPKQNPEKVASWKENAPLLSRR